MNKLSLKCADGTAVSPIALGTLYFGSRISQENCDALLDAFLLWEAVRLIQPEAMRTGFQVVKVPVRGRLADGYRDGTGNRFL